MKILYLSPTGSLGGAERVLLSVMKQVRRLRPACRLYLYCLSPGPLIDMATKLGVNVKVLDLPTELEAFGDSQLALTRGGLMRILQLLGRAFDGGGAAWRFLRRLRQQISGLRPDVIHSNGIKTHALSCIGCPAGISVIWHAHDFYSKRPLAQYLLRAASWRVSALVAVSTAVALDLKAVGLQAPITVIPNGANLDEFHPAPHQAAELDRLAGLPAPTGPCLRVGLVATYARWKGQAVFLETAARLTRRNPFAAFRFYIVGGPIYQTQGSQFNLKELQTLARQLGVADRVGFIEFQKEIAPIYQALDVAVHASTAAEPFGLTIIEAMACARPVVATLAGGVLDIITPGIDALGVPLADSEALADALMTLHREPGLRHELGSAALAKVRERFDESRVGPQFLDVYDLLVKDWESSSNVPAMRW